MHVVPNLYVTFYSSELGKIRWNVFGFYNGEAEVEITVDTAKLPKRETCINQKLPSSNPVLDTG
jgi:hypothetical protein